LLLEQNSELSDRQGLAFRRLCNLPRLNPGATRLLAVSAESDTEIEQFEEIFGSDPALTSELLLVANSAEFGLRGSAPNIKFALMLLGTQRVRSLAVTLALNRYARAAGSSGKPLWEHSVATAVIAEELGRQYGAQTAHLYTAGLTHDLGRLGLLLSGGAQYTAAIQQEFTSVAESNALERMHFGVTHCEAGAFLAKSWQFPGPLCRSILRHHDPLTPADDDFLRMTQAACVLASEIGFPELPHAQGDCGAHSFGPDLASHPELRSERLMELVTTRMQTCGQAPHKA
jgi:HD-like signal output (HDOD) protein